MNIKEIKAMSASELSKTLKEKKEELLTFAFSTP